MSIHWITVVLVLAKLVGIIGWPWWVVLLPTIAALSFAALFWLVALGFLALGALAIAVRGR